jgi:hypothetical protein
MAPPQQSEPEEARAEQGYRRRLRYCGDAEIVEHAKIVAAGAPKAVEQRPAQRSYRGAVTVAKIVAAKGEPAGERRAVQFHGVGLRRIVEDEVDVVPRIAREGAERRRVVAGDRIDRRPTEVG